MSTKTEKNTNLKSIVPNELGCTTSTKDSILQVRNLRKHYEVNKALNEEAGDIVRNNVPNYDYVSKSIRA